MKKALVFSVVLLLGISSLNAQYSHYYKDAQGKPAVEKKMPEIKNTGNYKPTREPEYTVTFHFVPTNITYLVILSSPDTSLFFEASNTAQVTLPAGYYQLYAEERPSFINPFIIADILNVDSDMDTTLNKASANIKITSRQLDENGNLMVPEESSKDIFGILFYFRPGAKWPFIINVYSGFMLTEMHTTPLPEGMKLRLGRHGVKKEGNKYKAYVANYDMLDGITHDTVVTNNPGDYHKFPLELNSTPAAREFFLGWGFGSIANPQLFGNTDMFIIGFMDESCPADKKTTVDYFVNPAANDSTIVWFGSNVANMEDSPYSPGFKAVLTAPLFLETTGKLVMSVRGNYPPFKGDYQVMPDETVSLIRGIPFNFHYGVSDPDSYTIRVYPYYRGIANERRFTDSQFSLYELWQGDELLMSDSLKNFQNYIGVPEPDWYKLVFKNTNYLVKGKPGKHVTELSFNLADTADANAPTPWSFSILQDNKATMEVIRDYPASVLFSAADLENLPDGTSIYHSLANAELFYKDGSSPDWLPLNLIPLTGELDSLAGMPYLADLTEIMTATADSAWIDLMMVLTDSAGNTNTQSFSPAFLLRDALVGTNEMELPGITIYPNPAKERVYFSSEAEKAILYSSAGIMIEEYQSTTSVNLSKMPAGLYFIKAVDKKGFWFTGKVVKN